MLASRGPLSIEIPARATGYFKRGKTYFALLASSLIERYSRDCACALGVIHHSAVRDEKATQLRPPAWPA